MAFNSHSSNFLWRSRFSLGCQFFVLLFVLYGAPHLFKSLISSLSFLYSVTNLLALAIKQPNVLLVCVDDLRPELGSFGVNYVKSPNIDRLAKEGRPFYRHYAQAPTCGASRYTFDGGGMALLTTEPLSFVPKTFDTPVSQHGSGKLDTLPYPLEKYLIILEEKVGLTGMMKASLRCPNPGTGIFFPRAHGNIRAGVMHGLAKGEIRKNANEMDAYQAFAGKDDSYPDGLILREAIKLDHSSPRQRNLSFWRQGSFVRTFLLELPQNI